MWIDGLGPMHIDPYNSRISVSADSTDTRWEPRLWGIPAALCFIAHGDISLHAAAIDVGGAAILLIGPSRFGKTTLAAAFLRAGHRLLAEDLCRCRLRPVAAVDPGPATLRLRRDSYRHLGALPGTHVVLEDDDRIHLALDRSVPEPVEPVPVRAAITLDVTDGPTVLERLDGVAAIPLLWSTSFNLPDREDRARCFLGVSELANRVPVWRLARRLEYDGLQALVDRIVAECLT